MGRTLYRVPLDFNHPINEIWPGYLAPCCGTCDCEGQVVKQDGELVSLNDINPTPPSNEWIRCPDCDGTGHGPDYNAPPDGPGYQLWETTSEGSPQSPVFESLDELCEWCEVNATTFADYRASAARWKEMLTDNFVCHDTGRVVFC